MLFNLFSIFLCLFSGLIFADPGIVYQPRLEWDDGNFTLQGTGSFVRTPHGSIVALTSAHFIQFYGPHLQQVDWLDIKTGAVVATSIKSWGTPGKAGTDNPLDLRSDYFLMVVEKQPLIPAHDILVLDDRKAPNVWERIWFPNKNPQSLQGFDKIEGKVIDVQNGYYLVMLDSDVNLQTRSGTPVLSSTTGKIIGILTGGGKQNGKMVLYLAPASSILQALIQANEYPLLEHVIGK